MFKSDVSQLFEGVSMGQLGQSFSVFTLSNYTVDEEVIRDSIEKKFLEVDNVRITPSVIIFRDAFEGRKFKEKIVIQNCGTKSAFVRICAPFSFAFKIDTIPRGQKILPGLKIVRTVSYTHNYRSNAPVTHLPIFINEKFVKYTLNVTKSFTQVTADPVYLDFGTVNADSFATSRTILLTNEGSQSTRFAVDLSANKLKLIVKPMRGQLEPRSSLELRVEVSGNKEGFFTEEFWIKCDTPLRIQVYVNFAFPKLEVLGSDATRDFTFVTFPKTFIGATHTRFLVIKNDSATDKMFCIKAELDKKTMSLSEAKEICQDYNYFHISPVEGRLKPYEGRIIEIAYSPKRIWTCSKHESHDDYAICFFRIIHVIARDLTESITFKADEDNIERSIKSNAFDSVSNFLSVTSSEEYFQLEQTLHIETAHLDKSDGYNKYRRVGIHGEFEKPNVTIRPNSLDIVDLKLKQKESRVLLLTNNSKHLQVCFRYKKTVCIQINPKKVTLKPLQSLEVSVEIIPTKIGRVDTKIIFEILYRNFPENTDVVVGLKSIPITYSTSCVPKLPKIKFNMGITPQITNEVGILTGEVKFNSPVTKPKAAIVNEQKRFKGDDDLVAFPNDRPTSLRPWKNDVPCKTIFAGIPRQNVIKDEYTLSESERQIKKLLIAHYNEYIRCRRENQIYTVKDTGDLDKSSGDYDVGDVRSLLLKESTYKNSPAKIIKTKSPPFIPMTPMELQKIEVYPQLINLNKVAKNSTMMTSVLIKNNNIMPIRIFMECHQSSVTITNGPRTVIPANSAEEITVRYFATEIGHYNVEIKCIINECHFLNISILVEVVAKYVEVNVKNIVFTSNDPMPKYIEVLNPLNAPVFYHWESQPSCFSIEPKSGIIEPNTLYPFLVTYTPKPMGLALTHFVMILENGFNVTIPVSAIVDEPAIVFKSTHIDADSIPLHVPIKKKLLLRNEGYETITMVVVDPNPIQGVSVYPQSYLLHGKSDLYITLEFNMKECVEFSFYVTLIIQDFYDKNITVSGTVDLPNITINPTTLNFGRIPVYAMKYLPLCIGNNSATTTKLSFDFQLYPGFYIGDKKEPFAKKAEVVMKHFESREFLIRFSPKDMVSCMSYFPFTINDAISTCVAENSKMILPEKIDDDANALLNKSVLKLHTWSIFLKASSSFPLLKFSSLQFDFKFFPSDQYDSITVNHLDITNVCSETVTFCFRTDDFDCNFSTDINTFNKVKVEEHAFSYVCHLEPDETITFQISFHPESPGIYRIVVPIFVRNQMNGAPFNCVTLNGFYPKPTIETNKRTLLLEPVPVGCFCTTLIEMKTLYHKTNCTIKVHDDLGNLNINFTEVNKLECADFEKNYKVIVTFTTFIPMSKLENVTFFCNCPAEKLVTIMLSSENSMITAHSFLTIHHFNEIDDVVPDMRPDEAYDDQPIISKDILLAALNPDTPSISNLAMAMQKYAFVKNVFLNESTYPFFPDDEDKSDYAEYMRATVCVLEEWTYEQCFYCRQFYSIPDGIRMRCHFEKKNRPNFVLPLMEMLGNLAKPFLENLDIDQKVPQENSALIYYLHAIYSKILNGLTNKGAHLALVRAEYLLEYEDYVYYMEETGEPSQFDEPILDDLHFQRLSKQCWMDVVLQVFKIFVLCRPEVPSRKKNVMNFMEHFEQLHVPVSDFYSTDELKLLYWLEYHFNDIKKEVWKTSELKYRHIEHFDEDLKDGVVLAAVTVAHCPFLADNVKSLFLEANTYEKQFYNAARLIEMWKLISVSFGILPQQIVKPNVIQMIFLVAYLFEYLPKLVPNQTITVYADHTKSVEKLITIKNCSRHEIAYQVKLFGSNIKNIECDTKLLIIEPKHEGSIIVTYHARKLAHLYAVILFLGDTPDYNYAKSIAMNLECIPNVSYQTDSKVIHCNVYQIMLSRVNIVSPYQEVANYDIYYTQDKPDNVEHFQEKLHEYRKVRDLMLPIEIFKQTGTIRTDSEGLKTFSFECCPILPIVREYIVYFCNENVGDFSVKFILDTDKRRIKYETISVRTPRDLNLMECICNKTKFKSGVKCPREITMSLPNRNYLMWSCIQEIFLRSLDKEDVPFWNKYLKTTAGNNLLKYLFEEEKDIAPMVVRHLFYKKVTYKVIPDRDPPPSATLPKSVTIDNVLCDGFVDVPIHLDVDQPKNFYFDMISVGKTEIRYYKVEFLPEI